DPLGNSTLRMITSGDRIESATRASSSVAVVQTSCSSRPRLRSTKSNNSAASSTTSNLTPQAYDNSSPLFAFALARVQALFRFQVLPQDVALKTARQRQAHELIFDAENGRIALPRDRRLVAGTKREAAIAARNCSPTRSTTSGRRVCGYL